MKRVFIGHRGVGKTSLLARHETYFPEIKHFDLDSEVETTTGRKISEIFKVFGESEFRTLEGAVFRKVLAENAHFAIAVGAGFDVTTIPEDCEVVFVSRVTDVEGRIFLNRPRMDQDRTPTDEFKVRYQRRQPRFFKRCDWIYHLSEGITGPNPIEKEILGFNFNISDAIYTLTEADIPLVPSLKKVFSRLELRTDLVSAENISNLISADPTYEWLYSVRSAKAPPQVVETDVDVQFFNQFRGARIISCHEHDLKEALALVRPIQKNYHVKLSPFVENFEDLLLGHRWQQVDPKNRSFLPRSINGKWLWFRQLSKYYQTLNFVRNRTGYLDQPSFYQWLILPHTKPQSFGAVLGESIRFTRSPEAHREFFSSRNSFFTDIDLSTAEFKQYFKVLVEFGLKHAAVTSPLKGAAFEMATEADDLATQFKAANTLVVENEKVIAINTDILGFEFLINPLDVKNANVAVWGGGGTLQMMKSVIPNAQYFSARLPDISNNFSPEVIVWAAPRLPDTQWPPEQWKPRLVIDLNYNENSMGIEYAQRKNCSYVSGLSMFDAQALAQQRFWSQS